MATGVALLIGSAVLLAGCGGKLNPFKEKEVPLPGERVSVLKADDLPTADPDAAKRPISLPPERTNEAWSQPGGPPTNAPGHLALGGGLRRLWTADAGKGSTSDGRLTARPIVYEGRVYTLDSQGTVSAFSASGGGRAWQVSLTPPNEKGREGYGGGLAADGGRLYAVTGFGTAVALNPANGTVLWTRKIGEPIRTSPTAADGKLFFVTSESEMHWLNGADGEVIWRYRGTPEAASFLSNVSPAVQGDVVIVPYPAGEVVAYRISARRPLWVESVAGGRSTTSIGSLRVPARPVIDNGVVFMSGNSGRTLAVSATTGERLWTQNVGSIQTPIAAGDTVFVLDVSGRLVALTRNDGRIRWVAELPDDARWHGPVLAGGRLWLVSASGQLIAIDAKTGQSVGKLGLGAPGLIAPVVAGGRMYIFTDNARLIALD